MVALRKMLKYPSGFVIRKKNILMERCVKFNNTKLITTSHFQKFTFIFYPTAMLISSLFLLLTLIAYVVDPDLHRPLFGKITLGFVFNNFIAYICLAGNYLSRHNRGMLPSSSFGCVAVGYLTLYTFTSFMFWINAMGANIFFKFSSILSSSSDNDRVKFVLYTFYAQVVLNFPNYTSQ